MRRPWRGLDPTVLLTAIAQKARRNGLVSTVHAIYGYPFSVARSTASLDHVSRGRAAWNIITSQNPPTLNCNQAYLSSVKFNPFHAYLT